MDTTKLTADQLLAQMAKLAEGTTAAPTDTTDSAARTKLMYINLGLPITNRKTGEVIMLSPKWGQEISDKYSQDVTFHQFALKKASEMGVDALIGALEITRVHFVDAPELSSATRDLEDYD